VRKFLLSALAILLAMGLMGSAFAYFSDTETSTGNTFTAGTWDIELYGKSLPVMARNMVCGESESETHMVHNVGSLSGKVWFTAGDFADPVGTYSEPNEPEPSTNVSPEAFAKVLYLKIEADLDQNWSFETVVYDGPVFGMESDSFIIDPDEWIECQFTIYLPADLDDPLTTGNEDDNLYQADGVMFTIFWNGDTDIAIN